MSMKKIDWESPPEECSADMTACLMAYMQHTLEQYPLSQAFWEREPTHCSQAIFLGSAWSDGRARWPRKGPEAERMRSYSRLVTTSGISP
jgi:hypothetical protein